MLTGLIEGAFTHPVECLMEGCDAAAETFTHQMTVGNQSGINAGFVSTVGSVSPTTFAGRTIANWYSSANNVRMTADGNLQFAGATVLNVRWQGMPIAYGDAIELTWNGSTLYTTPFVGGFYTALLNYLISVEGQVIGANVEIVT